VLRTNAGPKAAEALAAQAAQKIAERETAWAAQKIAERGAAITALANDVLRTNAGPKATDVCGGQAAQKKAIKAEASATTAAITRVSSRIRRDRGKKRRRQQQHREREDDAPHCGVALAKRGAAITATLANLPSDLGRNRILDAAASAAFWGVSLAHWRRMYRTGAVPAPIKVGERKLGWRVGALVDALKAREPTTANA
jgi:predicted DNA-binding transcriptional regulator AlpA